jgi:hypothetical protein
VTRGEFRRWLVLFGLVVAGIGGATSVWIVTSHNRAADRSAVLRYETQVIAPVRDSNVVAGSLADAADSYRRGRIDAATFERTLGVYRSALALDARRVDSVTVPIAFGAHSQMFRPCVHAYLDALDRYLTAARSASRDLAPADARFAEALSLYRAASRALADARSRLGLPASANFGDPPR